MDTRLRVETLGCRVCLLASQSLVLLLLLDRVQMLLLLIRVKLRSHVIQATVFKPVSAPFSCIGRSLNFCVRLLPVRGVHSCA